MCSSGYLKRRIVEIGRTAHAYIKEKLRIGLQTDSLLPTESIVSQHIDVQMELSKAAEMERLGKHEDAIVTISNIVQERPTNLSSIVILADLYIKTNDFLKAQHVLESGLGVYPSDVQLLTRLDTVSSIPVEPVIVANKLINKRPRSESFAPLVSVTIGTYNQELYVRDCVESVLQQTYTPLEIIIGDDASIDKTSLIIEECLAAYRGTHQVRFVKRSINLGHSGGGNWHDLFRKTNGDFIVQFAGDDVMAPNMIQEMVSVWRSRNVSMVVVNAELIDAKSKPLPKGTRFPPDSIPNDSIETLVRDGVNDSVFGAGFGCDRRFYEAFPPCAGNPPRHLRTQDILFPFLAGLQDGCVVMPQPLMKYRVHGNQNSLSIGLDSQKETLSKLILEEEMWQVHLAHAIWIIKVLDKAATIDSRFNEMRANLKSLIDNQIFIMSNRLTSVRMALWYSHGIGSLKMM